MFPMSLISQERGEVLRLSTQRYGVVESYLQSENRHSQVLRAGVERLFALCGHLGVLGVHHHGSR